MLSLKIAIQSLIKEKWINILSMVSIASALFILFFVFLLVYNVERLTRHLPEKLTVTVYLKEHTSDQETKKIQDVIKSEKIVRSIRLISKKDAIKELRESLRGNDYILEGLDENPLFASFDVRLKQGNLSAEDFKDFTKRIKALKGVDDIEYGERFFELLHSIKDWTRIFGLLIVTAFSIAIIFICYSTVKILFYRHKEDIEIYKLLGATKNFIRFPFLIEGSLIGLIAGLLVSSAILLISRLFVEKIYYKIPLLSFFTIPEQFAYILPIFGLFLVITGVLISLGRLKY